jgi:Subtilase family
MMAARHEAAFPARAAAPRRRARGRRPGPTTGAVLPTRIFAQASPRSLGGVSIFEAQQQITSATVANFLSDQETVNRAVNRLQDAGFEVLQATALTINIAGSAETYQRAFNTTIIAEERMAIKQFGVVTAATFLDSPDTPLPGLISTAGTRFEDVLEGVAIEEPRYLMAASMFPPWRAYWHLSVPEGVSLACNADRAHRSGITGLGVRVAMVDTGWFRHPYFVGRGYRAAPVVLAPGTANSLADEDGHGTGESANIFAIAPDIDFTMVKTVVGGSTESAALVNVTAGFNAAVGLNPHIITCSWGFHRPVGPLSAADQTLAASVAAAVASGITVIFAAGNGHAGFPGQHPDVISAGGVFMNPNETLQASNYASGFISNIYPGRRVPDLCGLVGMQPRAIYIMLPLEPGDTSDVDLSGGAHPNRDETANNDGWGAFSGTSAAAPQLAGAAALIKQACPHLTPAEIKDVLMTTARDVTTGSCNTVPGIHTGLPASAGPDTATGSGLVDVHKAVLVAKLRCLGPITPTPITPTPITPTPITPTPITPITPTPITPTPITPTPITPTPITPITPTPVTPITPQAPSGPQSMGQGTMTAGAPGAQQPPGRLSAQDVQALEEMVRNSEIDLDI